MKSTNTFSADAKSVHSEDDSLTFPPTCHSGIIKNEYVNIGGRTVILVNYWKKVTSDLKRRLFSIFDQIFDQTVTTCIRRPNTRKERVKWSRAGTVSGFWLLLALVTKIERNNFKDSLVSDRLDFLGLSF